MKLFLVRRDKENAQEYYMTHADCGKEAIRKVMRFVYAVESSRAERKNHEFPSVIEFIKLSQNRFSIVGELPIKIERQRVLTCPKCRKRFVVRNK